MSYVFRKAAEGEPEAVYAMVAKRVDWMEENGIHQWNETDYLNVFPLDYYRKMADHLYVLCDDKGRIMCAAILLEQDPRWEDKEDAFYIHNLAAVIPSCGAGRTLIAEAEKLGRSKGKRYLRLDSADDNEKLASYYENLGFKACGSCEDGLYHGILREKSL